MKTILLMTALALVGCKKTGGDAAGGPSCETAISKAIDTMTKTKAGGAPIAEMANKLRGVFVKHCEADKWSPDVINCFASASDQPSIKACRQKLPPEQAQAVQKEIMEMMMGSGGGMMPPHGGAMPPHGGGMGGTMGGPMGGAPPAETPPSGSPR